jgi:hypothetical protein
MKLMCDLQAEMLKGYSESSTESDYKRLPLISSLKPSCVQNVINRHSSGKGET